MPNPRLNLDTTVLLVIDLQEKLVPTIIDRDRLETNCAILLKMAAELGIPYFVTEQYPQGLGRTIEDVAQAMTDPSRRVEKTSFSAAVDLITDQLSAWRRCSVIICGIEAHVCVLQTVLDLVDSGYHCFLCTDAISASQHGQIAPALRRMERAGAIPTGVLSVMYELLKDAKHPSFRPLLELAKQIKQ
ncbi:MAG: isochorismatase family protein [Planctomycetota bacterium]|nr:isochorismatase family protein [Planctomycetota bacterium]